MKMSELSVEDIMNAQERARKNIDHNKNCNTCKFVATAKGRAPCDSCCDSFIGIIFEPSNWKAD